MVNKDTKQLLLQPKIQHTVERTFLRIKCSERTSEKERALLQKGKEMTRKNLNFSVVTGRNLCNSDMSEPTIKHIQPTPLPPPSR